MTTTQLPDRHRADPADAALVRAAQLGDAPAFGLLVEQLAASLRAVAIAGVRGSRLGRWFRDGMAAAPSADLSTAQWPLVDRVALGLPPAVPFVRPHRPTPSSGPGPGAGQRRGRSSSVQTSQPSRAVRAVTTSRKKTRTKRLPRVVAVRAPR